MDTIGVYTNKLGHEFLGILSSCLGLSPRLCVKITAISAWGGSMAWTKRKDQVLEVEGVKR